MILELIYQTNDYYPFGTPFSNNPSDVSFQKYKYNGKEFDMMHGLNTYDYGARQMDPVICQWTTVDPLAEEHYNVSPYAYCEDNPIKFRDNDGKDYNVFNSPYNQEGIIVSQTIYCTSSSAFSANKAAEFWNSQSNKFSYEGQYAIFDINVIVIDPEQVSQSLGRKNISDKQALSVTISQDKSGQANIFQVVDDSKFQKTTLNGNEAKINGDTYQSRIKIAKSRVNTETGAHEIGHTLGLGHYDKGLMTPASNDNNRSVEINQQEINDIIDNAKNERKDNAQGIGHFYNIF